MNKIQRLIAGIIGIKAAPAMTGRFMVVNGGVVWITQNSAAYITEGYQGNDIVYSAVKLVEEKVKLAPWAIYKVVDDSSLKSYKAFVKKGDYENAAKMQRKALEPITNYNLRTGKWNDLLNWPNEQETWGDFVANGAAFKMLTGNKFWWAELLEAGANAGLPNALYAMPPQYMTIIASTGWPSKVLGYQLNTGIYQQFDKIPVLHERYFNPSYDVSGAHLYGQSPMQAASKNLTRNNYAKTSTTKKFENSGADGVIFIDDERLTPEQGQAQVSAVKKVLSGEYTGAENSGKWATSGYKMGTVKLTDNVKDLMTLQFEELDLRRLANIWGIPSHILNDPTNSAQANIEESERMLTSRCVLPQLTACRDNLNRKKDDWGLKGENVYFDFDLSIYRELQEDQAKKWSWVKELVVPEAYKLDMMGLDIPDELPPDLIIIDGNKMTLTDLLNNVTPDQQRQLDQIENDD